jgi:hypothetical protein
MFRQERHGTDVLATYAEPLQDADACQEDWRRQPDLSVPGEQAKKRGRDGHERHGQLKGTLSPEAITDVAEKDSTEWPNQKADGKNPERIQQLGKPVLGREEQAANDRREETEQAEVIPLEQVADSAGEYRPVLAGARTGVRRVLDTLVCNYGRLVQHRIGPAATSCFA